MAELTTIARPYARAAFEYAIEAQALAKWEEMLQLVAVIADTDDMQDLICNPSVSQDELAAVIADVGSTAFDESLANFLKVVAANKRLVILVEVADLFRAMKAQYEKTIHVSVTTARELTAEQQKSLAAALEKRFQTTVDLESSVDQSLMGGLVIRADDLVIDGSLRGKLARLATSMLA
jgi:F-type H+-transporting ATPase subunit delta